MIAIVKKLKYKFGDTFILKPCFDWHVGNKACDIAAIRDYLRKDQDNPNAYLIGGGDMADSIIITDKRYSKDMDGSTQSRTNAILDDQIEQLEALLLPYKGRILGLGMGNHERTVLSKCGTHLMRRLSERLDTISLGYQWAITLRFEHKSGGHGRSLVVFGHHGWGGGTRTVGGSITKYSKHAADYEADIFFYGHDHKRDAAVSDFMGIQGELFVPKQRRIFLPGTFQRTFSIGDEPSWSETKGFNPVTLKGLNVYIKIVDGSSLSLRGRQRAAFPFLISSDL